MRYCKRNSRKGKQKKQTGKRRWRWRNYQLKHHCFGGEIEEGNQNLGCRGDVVVDVTTKLSVIDGCDGNGSKISRKIPNNRSNHFNF